MSTTEITSIDSLLGYLGDCGLFQVLVVIFLHGSIIASPWSMMFMAYGNYNPGLKCEDVYANASNIRENGKQNNTTITQENELSCDVYEKCKNVTFSNEASTIVTEWNLVCDRKWITSLMISIQMCGVLVGVLLVGQLNIHLGRKKCHYGALTLHTIFNLIASFSGSWPMFLVMRFFLGFTCGCIMLSGFVYPMEFVTNKWRGIVAALPFSSTGSLTFCLTAMLLKDWRYIHRATAILTAILILPVLWAPDSIRWLALKGKIKQAEDVGLKIAKYNRKPPASMDVIESIANTEKEIERNKPHYTILDLYRHGLLMKTFVITLTWFTNTIIYYTIIFDIQSLSGHFFVNMMLFSAITIISLPFVPLLTNTIGRKWGIIILMGLASVCCLVIVIMNFVDVGFNKGVVRLVLIFIIMIFIDAEWAIVQLFCVELYPTVLRSLSYSHASSVARIGGMIAPFLIPRDQSTAYISQFIMLVLVAFACFCIFFLPETKGRHLEESVTLKKQRKYETKLIQTNA